MQFPITFSATWPLLSGIPASVWEKSDGERRRRRYERIENQPVARTLQQSADYLARLVS